MANKWDDVDKILRDRKQRSKTSGTGKELVLEPEVLPAALPMRPGPAPEAPEPSNIIARFKTRQIERKLAAAQLTEYYDARMELLKHQLKEAVRARKAEATESAERFLMELNQNHLKFVAELGLSNVDKRQDIMMELNERTARRIEEIYNRDWPQMLKDQAIDELMKMSEDFADRLRHDLGGEN
jgi:hypothetical protein